MSQRQVLFYPNDDMGDDAQCDNCGAIVSLALFTELVEDLENYKKFFKKFAYNHKYGVPTDNLAAKAEGFLKDLEKGESNEKV